MTNLPTEPLTAGELREAIYSTLKDFGLPVGFLSNPKHWQYFNDALDKSMQLIAAHTDAVLERVESEVIGSDRKVPKEGVADERNRKVNYQNQFRAEQRQRLEQLKKDI